MTPDYIYGTLVALLYIVLLFSYSYLATCYRDEVLLTRLRKSVWWHGFLTYFVLSHACVIYFLSIYGTLVDVDDNISPDESTRDLFLRYTGTVLFFTGSILWAPFTICQHEGTTSAIVALSAPLLAVLGYILMVTGFVVQSFIPGTMDDCPCETARLATSGLIASLFAAPLFVFDCVWASSFYFKKYNYKTVQEPPPTPMGVVLETIEIGHV